MDPARKKKSCKYPKCHNAYYSNAVNKHFYKFPTNPQLHYRWKRCLKIDHSINCRNYIVCEDHFRVKDFVDSSTKHRLNHQVVPIEYIDDNDCIYHDHCYSFETNQNEANETKSTTLEQNNNDNPSTKNDQLITNPSINTDFNYIRIEGPDLKNIQSIAIPNNVSLPAPILIQTNQNLVISDNGQSLFRNLLDNTNSTNTKHIIIRKPVCSVSTSCNLVSPTIEMKFKAYQQMEKKLRAKIRLLQFRYRKSQTHLRELRTMFRKEDLIGLIEKRRFKSLSNLTETAEMLIISQLRNASKTSYARRYTEEELDFFIELYTKGPATYRFLDQFLILPSESTIRTVRHKRLNPNEHNYVIDVGCDLQELENLVNQNSIEIKQ